MRHRDRLPEQICSGGKRIPATMNQSTSAGARSGTIASRLDTMTGVFNARIIPAARNVDCATRADHAQLNQGDGPLGANDTSPMPGIRRAPTEPIPLRQCSRCSVSAGLEFWRTLPLNGGNRR